jgi:hypothetical protein
VFAYSASKAYEADSAVPVVPPVDPIANPLSNVGKVIIAL